MSSKMKATDPYDSGKATPFSHPGGAYALPKTGKDLIKISVSHHPSRDSQASPRTRREKSKMWGTDSSKISSSRRKIQSQVTRAPHVLTHNASASRSRIWTTWYLQYRRSSKEWSRMWLRCFSGSNWIPTSDEVNYRGVVLPCDGTLHGNHEEPAVGEDKIWSNIE